MEFWNSVFWFLNGKESVSVVKQKRDRTTINVLNGQVISINGNEIKFRNENTTYEFDGANKLPKVTRAFKKKSAKDQVLFSATLEVEDCRGASYGVTKGEITKVSR